MKIIEKNERDNVIKIITKELLLNFFEIGWGTRIRSRHYIISETLDNEHC